uniref:Hormone receptor 4 n=1 Tax=Macrostomum lignano TaxID=282301 RepID=A0A1I8J9C2_9PLAT
WSSLPILACRLVEGVIKSRALTSQLKKRAGQRKAEGGTTAAIMQQQLLQQINGSAGVAKRLHTDSEDQSDTDLSDSEGRLVIDMSNSACSTSINVTDCTENDIPTPPPAPPPSIQPKIKSSVDESCTFNRWWLTTEQHSSAESQQASPLPVQMPPRVPKTESSSDWWSQWNLQQQQQQQHQQQSSRRWGPPQTVSDRLCACIGCAVGSWPCRAWQPQQPLQPRHQSAGFQ